MLDDTKLFDFIKIMFERPKEWKLVKQHTKKRHTFMINRFFAIKFPDNANMFNLNGIEGSNVIDSWYMVAQRFKGVPAWIYTKTKKAPAVAKAKDQYIPSDEAVKFYMTKNEIGKREFSEVMKFFKKETLAELKTLDENIKVY